MKFDLVISNPPYAIGNQITSAHKDIAEQSIVLMPASKYKSNELYKYVSDIGKVADGFEDAVVGESLTIARLTPSAQMFVTFDELEISTFDSLLHKFYKNNFNKAFTYSYFPENRHIDQYGDVNTETYFVIGMRACGDGVHKTSNCIDYKWNVLRQAVSLPVSPGNYSSCIMFNFKSSQEKTNFVTFWYKGNLMNKLIKGMYKSAGKIYPAVPKVDWSRPWTDSQILAEYGYTEEEIEDLRQKGYVAA